MQKYRFLGSILACASLLAPTFALAESPLDGLNIAPNLDAPKIMSCEVEGNIKQLNTTSNEITYKVKYWSSYSKAGASYTLYGKVTNGGVTRTLLTLKGSAALTSGDSKYFSINGKQENTLRFAIKDNPGVTISMALDGKNCTSRYFKTINAMVNVQNQPALGSNVQLNGSVVQSDPVLVQQPSQGDAGVNGSSGGSVVSNNAAGIQASNDNLSQSGTVAAGDVTESEGVPVGDGGGVVTEGNVVEDSVETYVLPESLAALTKEEPVIEEMWSVKDYITVGLLGGILIAMVTYIVMKYRGMM